MLNPLDIFPPEIWDTIIGYCSKTTQLRLIQTCSYFSDIICPVYPDLIYFNQIMDKTPFRLDGYQNVYGILHLCNLYLMISNSESDDIYIGTLYLENGYIREITLIHKRRIHLILNREADNQEVKHAILSVQSNNKITEEQIRSMISNWFIYKRYPGLINWILGNSFRSYPTQMWYGDLVLVSLLT